ncbi:hypothetical protein WH267_23345, partial [Chryseobacterium sp. MYb328]
NNPIMFIDPDGRKILPYDYQAMQAEYTGFIESQGGGVMGQMLSGGGRLRTSFYPGNLGGNRPPSSGGYTSWWTGGLAGNATTSQEMVVHMKRPNIPEIRLPYYSPYNLNNVLDNKGFNLGYTGNVNDGVGGFAEGLSYSGKNGIKLYVGTARPDNPVNLVFTKFYGNGKTYIKPVYMGKAGNILGKASIAGTVVIGGVNIYNGIEKDGGTFGQNATTATGGTIGSAIGAYQGAVCAELGAGMGAFVGGVGAVPGALIGGIVGGIIGGIIGTEAGESVVN